MSHHAVAKLAMGVVCVLAILLSLAHQSEANYRKPPFNGSIFGKRGTSEYDPTGKALTALCEIANEACQAWFPSQENK